MRWLSDLANQSPLLAFVQVALAYRPSETWKTFQALSLLLRTISAGCGELAAIRSVAHAVDKAGMLLVHVTSCHATSDRIISHSVMSYQAWSPSQQQHALVSHVVEMAKLERRSGVKARVAVLGGRHHAVGARL